MTREHPIRRAGERAAEAVDPRAEAFAKHDLDVDQGREPQDVEGHQNYVNYQADPAHAERVPPRGES